MVSTNYLSKKVALLKVHAIDGQLDSVGNVLTTISEYATQGLLTPEAAKDIAEGYKSSTLLFLEQEVLIAAEEAVIHSLSAATESNDKNSVLVPSTVNPIAATNLIQTQLMVADGLKANVDLTNIITRATKILT